MIGLNIELLRKYIKNYKLKESADIQKFEMDLADRVQRAAYYQAWTEEKIMKMSKEDFFQYMSRLFAMLIWGNKQYVVDKVIADNGFDTVKKELSNLVWGNSSIEERWDRFRKNIKGIGPAMMSEILCYSNPKEYVIWNRRPHVALAHLGVQNLPKHQYQLDGEMYKELCELGKLVANEFKSLGHGTVDLMIVDYFFWDELQVEDNLNDLFRKKETSSKQLLSKQDTEPKGAEQSIHDEVRDKLFEIGKWLGFQSDTECWIASGAEVDTVWESSISNMGKIIYVFEVQSKGSIDSLLLNLLKALNNPSVQCVVAVSDEKQLQTIRREAEGIRDFHNKIRYWTHQEVLQVHENLSSAFEAINSLQLVPQGFLGKKGSNAA